MRTLLLALALGLLSSACATDDAEWIEAELGGGSMCATNGTQRCVTLRADTPVTVSISGPVNVSGVVVGPTPIEECWCSCTCAPGDPLGELVIRRDDDGDEVRVDLGVAGEMCCESI